MIYKTYLPIMMLCFCIALVSITPNDAEERQIDDSASQTSPNGGITNQEASTSSDRTENPNYKIEGWKTVTKRWPQDNVTHMIADESGHHFINTKIPDEFIDSKGPFEFEVEYHYDFQTLPPDIVIALCSETTQLVLQESTAATKTQIEQGSLPQRGKWNSFKHLLDASTCVKRRKISFHILLHDSGDTIAWKHVTLTMREQKSDKTTAVPDKPEEITSTEAIETIESTDQTNPAKLEDSTKAPEQDPLNKDADDKTSSHTTTTSATSPQSGPLETDGKVVAPYSDTEVNGQSSDSTKANDNVTGESGSNSDEPKISGDSVKESREADKANDGRQSPNNQDGSQDQQNSISDNQNNQSGEQNGSQGNKAGAVNKEANEKTSSDTTTSATSPQSEPDNQKNDQSGQQVEKNETGDNNNNSGDDQQKDAANSSGGQSRRKRSADISPFVRMVKDVISNDMTVHHRPSSLLDRFKRDTQSQKIKVIGCSIGECNEQYFDFKRFRPIKQTLPSREKINNEDYFISYPKGAHLPPKASQALSVSLQTPLKNLSDHEVCLTWLISMDKDTELRVYYKNEPATGGDSSSQLITTIKSTPAAYYEWKRFKLCTSDYVFKLLSDEPTKFLLLPHTKKEDQFVAIHFAKRGAITISKRRKSHDLIPSMANVGTSSLDDYWQVRQTDGDNLTLKLIEEGQARNLLIECIDRSQSHLDLTTRWIRMNPSNTNELIKLNYEAKNQDWINAIDLYIESAYEDLSDAKKTSVNLYKRQKDAANSVIKFTLDIQNGANVDRRFTLRHTISGASTADVNQQKESETETLIINKLSLGDLCDQEQPYCQHGGQCIPTGTNKAQCKCLQGFEGNNCEIFKPCEVLYDTQFGQLDGRQLCKRIRASGCIEDLSFLRCKCPDDQYFEFGSSDKLGCRPFDVCIKCDPAAGYVCRNSKCVCDIERGFTSSKSDAGKCEKITDPCDEAGGKICGEAKCISQPNTHQYDCVCPIGYKKVSNDDDTKSTKCKIDNQICTNPLLNDCEHTCTINEVSNEYDCSCLEGYKLADDKRACYPEHPIDPDCIKHCGPNELCVISSKKIGENSPSYSCTCDRQGYYTISRHQTQRSQAGNKTDQAQHGTNTSNNQSTECMTVCDAAKYDRNISALVRATCKTDQCSISERQQVSTTQESKYLRPIRCNCSATRFPTIENALGCQVNLSHLTNPCVSGNVGHTQCVKQAHALCMVNVSRVMQSMSEVDGSNYVGYSCVCPPGKKWASSSSVSQQPICVSECREQQLDNLFDNKYCVDGTLDPSVQLEILQKLIEPAKLAAFYNTLSKEERQQQQELYQFSESVQGTVQCLPGFELENASQDTTSRCLQRPYIVYHTADIKLPEAASIDLTIANKLPTVQELRQQRNNAEWDPIVVSCESLLTDTSINNSIYRSCFEYANRHLRQLKQTYTDYDSLVAAKFRDSADTLGPAKLNVDRALCNSQFGDPTNLKCRVLYSSNTREGMFFGKNFNELRYDYNSSHDLLAPSLLVSKATFDELDQRITRFDPCKDDIDYCDYRSECKLIAQSQFECVCKPGYREIRKVYNEEAEQSTRQTISASSQYGRAQCEDIDECKYEACANVANSVGCINTDGSYLCPCKEHYIGDDKTYCVHVCDKINCTEEYGKCVPLDKHQAYCECKDGRSGVDCSIAPITTNENANRKLIIILSVIATSLILFGAVIIGNLIMRIVQYKRRLTAVSNVNRELKQRVGPASGAGARVGGATGVAFANQSFDEW